jgi:hypothetical protein
MDAMVDREARERIQALEEWAAQRDRETAELSARLLRGAADIARLAAAVEAIRASLRLPSPAVISSPHAPAPAAPFVLAIEELHADISALKAWPAGFASLIVADFPALFAEFRGKRFTLLWRGSRDGFGARHFHGRCDGHAPTLALIHDTEGNIFGGFTPAKWESVPKWEYKADPSLKSFLFTLKNPHNLPPTKFPLKLEQKESAIFCLSSCGPHFGNIYISDDCDASPSNDSSLGRTDANGTGLDGQKVLTGSQYFTVKEIEVFEIAD